MSEAVAARERWDGVIFAQAMKAKHVRAGDRLLLGGGTWAHVVSVDAQLRDDTPSGYVWIRLGDNQYELVKASRRVVVWR